LERKKGGIIGEKLQSKRKKLRGGRKPGVIRRMRSEVLYGFLSLERA